MCLCCSGQEARGRQAGAAAAARERGARLRSLCIHDPLLTCVTLKHLRDLRRLACLAQELVPRARHACLAWNAEAITLSLLVLARRWARSGWSTSGSCASSRRATAQSSSGSPSRTRGTSTVLLALLLASLLIAELCWSHSLVCDLTAPPRCAMPTPDPSPDADAIALAIVRCGIVSSIAAAPAPPLRAIVWVLSLEWIRTLCALRLALVHVGFADADVTCEQMTLILILILRSEYKYSRLTSILVYCSAIVCRPVTRTSLSLSARCPQWSTHICINVCKFSIRVRTSISLPCARRRIELEKQHSERMQELERQLEAMRASFAVRFRAFCFMCSAFPLARLGATAIISARCAAWSARSLHARTDSNPSCYKCASYVPEAASPSQVNNSYAKFPLFAFHTVHTCVN